MICAMDDLCKHLEIAFVHPLHWAGDEVGYTTGESEISLDHVVAGSLYWLDWVDHDDTVPSNESLVVEKGYLWIENGEYMVFPLADDRLIEQADQIIFEMIQQGATIHEAVMAASL